MVSETDHKDITIKRHDKMQNQRHENIKWRSPNKTPRKRKTKGTKIAIINDKTA